MNAPQRFLRRLAANFPWSPGIAAGRKRRSHLKSLRPAGGSEVLESRSLLSATTSALSVSNVTVTEGNSGQRTAVVNVSLDNASSVPVTVRYATRDGSAKANIDYVAQSGIVRIPAGSTSVRVSLIIKSDRIDEQNETFRVVLTAPANATIAKNFGTVLIRDDDPVPVINISSVKVTEGNLGGKSSSILVSLDTPSGLPVTVRYRAQNVTAQVGSDYQLPAGTLTIPPGMKGGRISLVITGDTIDEPNEAFTVVLFNSVNATLARRVGTVTINDDDGVRLPLFKLSDMAYLGAFRVPEGQVGSSTFEFGGNSLAFNATNNSLFTASGFDEGVHVAEIGIPAQLSTDGAIAGMAIATVLQPFTNLGGLLTVNAGGEMTHPRLGYEDLHLGGLLVAGNGLTGGMFMGYNGAEPEESTHSHFRTSNLNLSAISPSEFSGLMDIRSSTDSASGRVRGGYMTEVPEQWRAWIGADYVTGAAGQNRIQFSSSGPALFGFDANNPQASSGKPLVNYPFGHALQWFDGPGNSPQLMFNGTTSIVGVSFVPGTRSVIFLGSNGLSAIGYGVGSAFNDEARPYSGFHSQNGNYEYQIWAYDIDDFMSVRNGTLASWNIKPTSVVNFSLPTPESAKYLGGTAFDPSTGRLYVSQKLAGPGATPIIHVYQLGRTNTTATSQAPTQAVGAIAPAFASFMQQPVVKSGAAALPSFTFTAFESTGETRTAIQSPTIQTRKVIATNTTENSTSEPRQTRQNTTATTQGLKVIDDLFATAGHGVLDLF